MPNFDEIIIDIGVDTKNIESGLSTLKMYTDELIKRMANEAGKSVKDFSKIVKTSTEQSNFDGGIFSSKLRISPKLIQSAGELNNMMASLSKISQEVANNFSTGTSEKIYANKIKIVSTAVKDFSKEIESLKKGFLNIEKVVNSSKEFAGSFNPDFFNKLTASIRQLNATDINNVSEKGLSNLKSNFKELSMVMTENKNIYDILKKNLSELQPYHNLNQSIEKTISDLDLLSKNFKNIKLPQGQGFDLVKQDLDGLIERLVRLKEETIKYSIGQATPNAEALAGYKSELTEVAKQYQIINKQITNASNLTKKQEQNLTSINNLYQNMNNIMNSSKQFRESLTQQTINDFEALRAQIQALSSQGAGNINQQELNTIINRIMKLNTNISSTYVNYKKLKNEVAEVKPYRILQGNIETLINKLEMATSTASKMNLNRSQLQSFQLLKNELVLIEDRIRRITTGASTPDLNQLEKWKDRVHEISVEYNRSSASVYNGTQAMYHNFNSLLYTITRLGYMFGLSFNMASVLSDIKDFNKELDTFDRKIAGLERTSLKTIREFRKEFTQFTISENLPKSFDELQEAVEWAVSSGVSLDDTLGVLNKTVELSVGGIGDLKDTMDLTTSIVDAFGVSLSDLGDINDIIQTGINEGKYVLQDFNENLAKMAPQASQAGVSLENMVTAFSALTRIGMNSEMASSGMGRFIEGIIKPSDEAVRLTKQLGIAFDETALKTMGLVKFINYLKDEIKENKNQINELGYGTMEFTKILFNSIQGGRVALSLLGNANKTMNDIDEAMKNRAGASKEAFDKNAESLENMEIRLKNLMNASAEASEGTLKMLHGLVLEIGTAFFTGTETIGGFGQAVVFLSASIGLLLPGLKTVIGLFKSIFLASKTTTIGLIVATIATLLPLVIGGFQRLFGLTKKTNEETKELKKSFEEIANEDIDRISDKFENVNQVLNKSKKISTDMVKDFESLEQAVLDYNFAKKTGLGDEEKHKKIIKDIVEEYGGFNTLIKDTNGLYDIRYEKMIEVLKLEEKNAEVQLQLLELNKKQINAELRSGTFKSLGVKEGELTSPIIKDLERLNELDDVFHERINKFLKENKNSEIIDFFGSMEETISFFDSASATKELIGGELSLFPELTNLFSGEELEEMYFLNEKYPEKIASTYRDLYQLFLDTNKKSLEIDNEILVVNEKIRLMKETISDASKIDDGKTEEDKTGSKENDKIGDLTKIPATLKELETKLIEVEKLAGDKNTKRYAEDMAEEIIKTFTDIYLQSVKDGTLTDPLFGNFNSEFQKMVSKLEKSKEFLDLTGLKENKDISKLFPETTNDIMEFYKGLFESETEQRKKLMYLDEYLSAISKKINEFEKDGIDKNADAIIKLTDLKADLIVQETKIKNAMKLSESSKKIDEYNKFIEEAKTASEFFRETFYLNQKISELNNQAKIYEETGNINMVEMTQAKIQQTKNMLEEIEKMKEQLDIDDKIELLKRDFKDANDDFKLLLGEELISALGDKFTGANVAEKIILQEEIKKITSELDEIRTGRETQKMLIESQKAVADFAQKIMEYSFINPEEQLRYTDKVIEELTKQLDIYDKTGNDEMYNQVLTQIELLNKDKENISKRKTIGDLNKEIKELSETLLGVDYGLKGVYFDEIIKKYDELIRLKEQDGQLNEAELIRLKKKEVESSKNIYETEKNEKRLKNLIKELESISGKTPEDIFKLYGYYNALISSQENRGNFSDIDSYKNFGIISQQFEEMQRPKQISKLQSEISYLSGRGESSTNQRQQILYLKEIKTRYEELNELTGEYSDALTEIDRKVEEIKYGLDKTLVESTVDSFEQINKQLTDSLNLETYGDLYEAIAEAEITATKLLSEKGTEILKENIELQKKYLKDAEEKLREPYEELVTGANKTITLVINSLGDAVKDSGLENTFANVLEYAKEMQFEVKEIKDESGKLVKLLIKNPFAEWELPKGFKDKIDLIIFVVSTLIAFLQDFFNNDAKMKGIEKEIDSLVKSIEKLEKTFKNASIFSGTEIFEGFKNYSNTISLIKDKYKELEELKKKHGSGGFFGIGAIDNSQAIKDMENDIAELEAKLKTFGEVQSFLGTTPDDIAGIITSGFNEANTEDFLNSFDEGLQNTIRNALLKSFLVNQLSEPLKELGNLITQSVMDNDLTEAEKEEIEKKANDIKEKTAQFKDTVDTLFEETQGSFKSAQETLKSELTEETANKLVGLFQMFNIAQRQIKEALYMLIGDGGKLDIAITNIISIETELIEFKEMVEGYLSAGQTEISKTYNEKTNILNTEKTTNNILNDNKFEFPDFGKELIKDISGLLNIKIPEPIITNNISFGNVDYTVFLKEIISKLDLRPYLSSISSDVKSIKNTLENGILKVDVKSLPLDSNNNRGKGEI